jgi:hypothetical protein
MRSGVVALAAALVVSLGAVTESVGARAPVAALSPCWSPDNGSPELRGLKVSPGAVDVARGQRLVRVVVDAVDTGGPGAASGVDGGYVVLETYWGGYIYELLRRTARGAWVATITFPRGSLWGEWDLGVGLWDRVGNRSGRLGYSSVELSGGPSRPARIRDLALGASKVDTRRRGHRIPVTARHSTGGATTQIEILAEERNGSHEASAVLHPVAESPGIFRGSLWIPRWQTSGRWRVTRLHLTSMAQYLEKSLDLADLRRRGFLRGFRVVSGPDDISDPELRGFALAPGTVDVRQEPGSVAARMRIRDTVSGVAEARLVVRHAYRGFETSVPLHLTAGTRWRGTWEGVVLLDTCEMKAGEWRTEVVITDRSGNERTYRKPALAAAGWSNSFSVLTNDNRPPEAVFSRTDPRSVTLHFDEVVTGISTESVISFLTAEFTPTETAPGPPIPGQWTCQTAAQAATDCLTGNVRYATFEPTGDHRGNVIEINPNHQLGVMDRAGNPPDRLLLLDWGYVPT